MSGRHLGRDPQLGALSGAADDPVTPAGPEILALADAVVGADAPAIGHAAERLAALVGSPGVIRVIAVAANFQMMNRMLDALGVDFGGSREIAAAIGVPFATRG